MSISSASEPELLLISLAGSVSTSTGQEGYKIKRRWREGWEWGRLFEGGDYFKYFRLREAIIRGTRLIKGRLLFVEI